MIANQSFRLPTIDTEADNISERNQSGSGDQYGQGVVSCSSWTKEWNALNKFYWVG